MTEDVHRSILVKANRTLLFENLSRKKGQVKPNMHPFLYVDKSWTKSDFKVGAPTCRDHFSPSVIIRLLVAFASARTPAGKLSTLGTTASERPDDHGEVESIDDADVVVVQVVSSVRGNFEEGASR